jgi:hypothetical protein
VTELLLEKYSGTSYEPLYLVVPADAAPQPQVPRHSSHLYPQFPPHTWHSLSLTHRSLSLTLPSISLTHPPISLSQGGGQLVASVLTLAATVATCFLWSADVLRCDPFPLHLS